MILLKRCYVFLDQLKTILNKGLKIKSIVFDCAYFSPQIARFCRKNLKNIQVISQIKSNQIVTDKKGRRCTVVDYFKEKKPKEATVLLRGNFKTVTYIDANLLVKSHKKILRIIALKYEGEEKYRYVACIDRTWDSLTIIRTYSFRWLIEVANFDWKQYDGWGKAASQHGADGACRGVNLSLLVDCFLLSHPVQISQSRAGLQLWTAGSVIKRLKCDNLKEKQSMKFLRCQTQLRALRN